MSNLVSRLLGILIVLLVISSEVAPQLLLPKVLAQESAESFISKLEGYLKDALPPESKPIEEAEYIVPEGFNVSYAERLWRALAPFVSLGYSRDEIVNITKSFASTARIKGKEAKLNFSGLRVERLKDGSVELKIPVVGENLSYTYYNSTNIRLLYKVWNETLVKYYDVKKIKPIYKVTYRNVETGESTNITLRPFLNFSAVENETRASLGLRINVNDQYEDVVTVIPEHKEKFTVLFPGYTVRILVARPIVLSNGSDRKILTKFTSNWVPIGNYLTIFYSAESLQVNPSNVPLKAVLRVKSSGGFEVRGNNSAYLTNSQPHGVFFLKATKEGTYNITLTLEGNAVFFDGSKELTFSAEVLGADAPSIVVSVLNVTLAKGSARLEVIVKNVGNGTAFLPCILSLLVDVAR